VRSRIDFERTGGHAHRHRRPDTSPDERAQAGVELADVERFGQVVIGAAVEAGDAGVDAVAGGQHQHRYLRSTGAELLAQLQTVDEWQHHVEDDSVVVGDRDELQNLSAIRRDVHGIGLLAQSLREHSRRVRLVLDQQNTHGDLLCANSREGQANSASHHGWAHSERLGAAAYRYRAARHDADPGAEDDVAQVVLVLGQSRHRNVRCQSVCRQTHFPAKMSFEDGGSGKARSRVP